MELLIKLFFCAALFSFGNKVIAQESKSSKNVTYYIVRHGEKAPGNNPPLSKIGQERAGDLYRKLKNKKIDLIFVSEYPRTGMTADSLRIYQQIDSVHYKADLTGKDLFEKIEERRGKAKNILIVGHSNTLPGIIRRAGISSFTLKDIPDAQYNNLFIIKVKKGKTKMKQKVYGKE